MNIIEDRVNTNPWFAIGASSILGTRSYQQDFAYFYTGSQDVLAVVCDGMGGLQGGERASKTAVQLLAQDFQKEKPIKNIPAFLKREAGRMDQAVAALKDEKGKPLEGGTTLVAVYCHKNQMYWASVGDSRIYLIRDGKITSENREHNYRLLLQEQLAAGKITREFYEKEEKTPQAEALISFLGMNGLRVVDVTKMPVMLQSGDMVMLCSDGVYKSLNDSQVCAMAMDNDLDMYIAADRTTAMALRYGRRGQDNTTVILMKYLGE
ncbi:MAG: serine/threonine-protein phosphatase [Lachnospiraceae bacterium]|nr:serine/threonine-protein phosphatase [Lachnospiraceae bacterium]